MLKLKLFSNYYIILYYRFLSGEKIELERCMSAEGSSVKGNSQQSSTSFPKVKGGGPLLSGRGPLITGGLVNDTTQEI